jgi:phytoene synthase
MSKIPTLSVDELGRSYELCHEIAKREARNFYYSFLTLSRTKRNAMYAIYSWMRRLDDLADDAASPFEAEKAVQQWKELTHEKLDRSSRLNGSLEPKGMSSTEDLWPALVDTVQRFKIPHHYFDEIIEGALMDQNITRYHSFEDLYQYCYRVASVVGLVCLRVFEFTNPQAEKNGEWLGIAFQLTNILRDVREDAERGRIYLPLSDLKEYGISEEDILEKRWSASLHDYFKSFSEKIESYYEKARPITGLVAKESRPTLKIMTEIYHGILDDIKRLDYQIFERRARVPTWKKFAIVAKYQLGLGH